MSSLRGLRDDRPHDGGPTDVDRGVVVGGCRVPARLAEEVVPTLSVGLLAVPALGASSRRVARVNEVDQHAREQRLVLDEAPKLKVAPGFMSRSLRLSNRSPLPDACEVWLRPAGGAARMLSVVHPLDDVAVSAQELIFALRPMFTNLLVKLVLVARQLSSRCPIPVDVIDLKRSGIGVVSTPYTPPSKCFYHLLSELHSRLAVRCVVAFEVFIPTLALARVGPVPMHLWIFGNPMPLLCVKALAVSEPIDLLVVKIVLQAKDRNIFARFVAAIKLPALLRGQPAHSRIISYTGGYSRKECFVLDSLRMLRFLPSAKAAGFLEAFLVNTPTKTSASWQRHGAGRTRRRDAKSSPALCRS
jgi:hypothetical protein